MQNLLLVAVGGGAGAVMRYLLGVQTMRAFGTGWPYGTLAFRGGADQERWRLLLGVGGLGGFTTFSAYSLEVALMLERREWASAATYSLGSVVLSVGALFAGLILMRRLLA